MIKKRRNDLKRRYQITPEEYEALLIEQGGLCAICRQPERVPNRRTGEPINLAVDHCHATGKVRGLLCARCNKTIGSMKENPYLVLAALEYVTRHKEEREQTS